LPENKNSNRKYGTISSPIYPNSNLFDSLPISSKPLTDEYLLGWLCRLAHVNDHRLKPVASSNGCKPVASSNGCKPVASSNGCKPVIVDHSVD